MTRYAVQGYAAIYRRPYVGEHGISALEPGCFANSLQSGKTIHFQHDHNPNQRVGSNRSGLTFHDTSYGLAFRLENPPASVLNAIRSGDRRSMSVGFDFVKTEKVQADNVEFTLIQQAELGEVSLVRRPAISNTSVSIVDLAEVGDLRHCAESGSFRLRGQHTALNNALDDVRAMSASLLNESAELLREVMASAKASSRSASRGQRRVNKRRAMPIVDLTFAKDAYAMQPGAWETYMFMAGEDAFSNYINARRPAQ